VTHPGPPLAVRLGCPRARSARTMQEMAPFLRRFETFLATAEDGEQSDLMAATRSDCEQFITSASPFREETTDRAPGRYGITATSETNSTISAIRVGRVAVMSRVHPCVRTCSAFRRSAHAM